MATTFNARSYSAVAYDQITGITTGVQGAAAGSHNNFVFRVAGRQEYHVGTGFRPLSNRRCEGLSPLGVKPNGNERADHSPQSFRTAVQTVWTPSLVSFTCVF